MSHIIVPHEGLTFLHKPYEFLKGMRNIPNLINLRQFKVITNFRALSIGNPIVSHADLKNYFEGLCFHYGVGNKIKKSKLIALDKHEHNRRVGRPPLKTKGDMNKHKCCKSCTKNKAEVISCGCSEDGTGTYWCRGTECNETYEGCSGLSGFDGC